eukprot:1773175-Amphidinium_carterae.1
MGLGPGKVDSTRRSTRATSSWCFGSQDYGVTCQMLSITLMNLQSMHVCLKLLASCQQWSVHACKTVMQPFTVFKKVLDDNANPMRVGEQINTLHDYVSKRTGQPVESQPVLVLLTSDLTSYVGSLTLES